MGEWHAERGDSLKIKIHVEEEREGRVLEVCRGREWRVLRMKRHAEGKKADFLRMKRHAEVKTVVLLRMKGHGEGKMDEF